MTDPLARSVGISLGNWRSRRAAKGKPPTDDDLRREALSRWPDLTDDQIIAAIAVCKTPRDER